MNVTTRLIKHIKTNAVRQLLEDTNPKLLNLMKYAIENETITASKLSKMKSRCFIQLLFPLICIAFYPTPYSANVVVPFVIKVAGFPRLILP